MGSWTSQQLVLTDNADNRARGSGQLCARSDVPTRAPSWLVAGRPREGRADMHRSVAAPIQLAVQERGCGD